MQAGQLFAGFYDKNEVFRRKYRTSLQRTNTCQVWDLRYIWSVLKRRNKAVVNSNYMIATRPIMQSWSLRTSTVILLKVGVKCIVGLI